MLHLNKDSFSNIAAVATPTPKSPHSSLKSAATRVSILRRFTAATGDGSVLSTNADKKPNQPSNTISSSISEDNESTDHHILGAFNPSKTNSNAEELLLENGKVEGGEETKSTGKFQFHSLGRQSLLFDFAPEEKLFHF